MRPIRTILLASILMGLTSSAFCQENKWKLPLEAGDQNTKVNFEVNSTWVLVEGTTANLTGQIKYLQDQPDTFETDISIPVNSMKTGLQVRDTKLIRLMAGEKYPLIKVHLLGSDLECNPARLSNSDSCILKQKGSLEIRGIQREISLNSLVKKTAEGFSAEGEITFPWADFEVEDPSILVAKLDPDVKVLYKISWQ